MIRINLLPSDMVGKRSATGGKKAKPKGSGALTPYVLGLLLGLAGAGYFGWSLYAKASDAQRRLAEAKKTLADREQKIKDQEKDFLAQNAEAQEIEEKFAVVQALNPARRLYWSEKLNQLSLAKTKAAVFLTEISVDERVEEQETPDSVRRRNEYEEKKKNAKQGQNIGPPPNVVKIPVIHQTLTIQGIAYGKSSPQQLRQVTLFMNALRDLEWVRKSGEKTRFYDGFEPEPVVLPHKVGRVGEVDVLHFGLKLKATPQMSELDKPTPGAPAAPGKPAA